MDKIIPILPCCNITEQMDFYKAMGFEIVAIYTNPNPYACVRYNELDINFYGSKKHIPKNNPIMSYISVSDVDNIYEIFTSNLRKNLGKVPNNGIPRLTKLKDLKNDRRFTLTDPGGNTLYIGTPIDKPFLRTIQSEIYGVNYELLYDLLYSKEDAKVANNLLQKSFPTEISEMNLMPIDTAKMLLILLDLEYQLTKIISKKLNSQLTDLIIANKQSATDWEKIIKKHSEILNND